MDRHLLQLDELAKFLELEQKVKEKYIKGKIKACK